jgi:hypothetical protein
MKGQFQIPKESKITQASNLEKLQIHSPKYKDTEKNVKDQEEGSVAEKLAVYTKTSNQYIKSN